MVRNRGAAFPFTMRHVSLHKIELYGLFANIAGVIAVAESIVRAGAYLSVPGVALATLGMILMCFRRVSSQ
jgi:hypothetical protein